MQPYYAQPIQETAYYQKKKGPQSSSGVSVENYPAKKVIHGHHCLTMSNLSLLREVVQISLRPALADKFWGKFVGKSVRVDLQIALRVRAAGFFWPKQGEHGVWNTEEGGQLDVEGGRQGDLPYRSPSTATEYISKVGHL